MAKRDDGGPAVLVPLKNGGHAVMSPEDAERVLALDWRRHARGAEQGRRLTRRGGEQEG